MSNQSNKQKMKSRHRKNKSLVNQYNKSNSYTHHRSFSFNRYLHKNTMNVQNNCAQNQNVIYDSMTLPMSTEFNRENKVNKKGQSKEGSQQLNKDKKVIKSKDKDSNSRKRKEKNKINRDKNSNQRAEKSHKKDSKELLRNKKSLERVKVQTSGERKNKNSEQKKGIVTQRPKPKIQKIKSNGKRKSNYIQQSASNWQQVIHNYGQYLHPEEIGEIKQYKWIYFLGKIKDRKSNKAVPLQKLKKPLSARESDNNDYDDEFYKYQIGDHIAYRYQIMESINKGSFGEVVKVLDHKSKQFLALKIVKKSQEIVQQTYVEVAILTHIKEKDKSDVSGIVRIKDFTIFRNHICIVFQLLEGNLYELLETNNYNGLSEEVIRIFAVQILNSLSFLHQERIIHCDIKPQNIVMRSWGKSRVKLIDFGSSCFNGQQMFQYLQSRYYRAPEVMLRLNYSYEIDMWSFGCLLLQLRIGQPIFAGSHNTEQLMYICNSIGYPSSADGKHSKLFLQSEQLREIMDQNYIEEYKYMHQNGMDMTAHPFFSRCKYIKNCMKTIKERLQGTKTYAKQDAHFLKFIQKILVWEPEKRLRPQQALQDSWILKGLPTEIKQFYTILNSVEYKGQQKGKSKQQKSSKNKGSKRSSDKSKTKQLSGRKDANQLKSRQQTRGKDSMNENKHIFNNKLIHGYVSK